MKVLWIFIIVVVLLPITCLAEDRWYEGEESSSCDFACSMERVVNNAPDGTAYMPQDEVSATAMREMRIEQEARAAALAPSAASYGKDDLQQDAKTFSPSGYDGGPQRLGGN